MRGFLFVLGVCVASTLGTHEHASKTVSKPDLVAKLDQWRLRLTERVAADRVNTTEQLASLRSQSNGASTKLSEISSGVLLSQALANAIEKHLEFRPFQQGDITSVSAAQNELYRMLTQRCIEEGTAERASRSRQILTLVQQMTTYVNVTLADVKNASTAAPSSTVPDTLSAHVASTSLLGLSLSTPNSTFPQGGILNCSRPLLSLTPSQRQWCCEHQHRACVTTDVIGMFDTILEKFLTVQNIVENEVQEIIAVSTRLGTTCQSRSVELVNRITKLENMLSDLSTRSQLDTLRVQSLRESSIFQMSRAQEMTDSIQLMTTQMDILESALEHREQARQQEILSIDTLRRLVVATDSSSGVRDLANGGTGQPKFDVSGKSPETAGRTCLDLKRRQPSLPDGIYWIDLGEGADRAFEAYCDMTTEGGGFTLILKNVSKTIGRPLGSWAWTTTSRMEGGSLDIIYPVWSSQNFDGGVNDRLFDFFASRSRQQWLKTMQLSVPSRSSSSMVPFITQAILVKLGQNSLADVLQYSNATEGGNECRSLSGPAQIFTSRPSGSGAEIVHPVGGHVDHFAGSSSLLTIPSHGASGLGFASLSPNAKDTCSLGTDLKFCADNQLVCDASGLKVLDAETYLPTIRGSGVLISSFFSSDCIFDCPRSFSNSQLLAGLGELVVFAARSEACPSNDYGMECSGNGVCEDGVCKCGYGFSGLDCSSKICVGDCVHGKCVDGRCVCDPGYLGDSCNDSVMCGKIPDWIPHYVGSGVKFERGGRVTCTGNHFGDSCTFACDDRYRTRQVSAVTIKNWDNGCHNQATHVITAPLLACSAVSDGLTMFVSEPDASGDILVQRFNGNDCSGTALDSHLVSCAMNCEEIDGALISVSCHGTLSHTRECGVSNQSTTAGDWTNDPAECVLSRCKPLEVPDHAHALCSGEELSDRCRVQCNEGYDMFVRSDVVSGDVEMTCQDGDWQSGVYELTQLRCDRKKCPIPQRPLNGRYECSSMSYGDVCSLACHDQYQPRLGAPLTISCRSDGTWFGVDLNACVPDLD